jgi:hypothetical protein
MENDAGLEPGCPCGSQTKTRMAFVSQQALVAVSVRVCCGCKVARARLTACDKRSMNMYCHGLFCEECVQCHAGMYGAHLDMHAPRCFCLWTQCQCLAFSKKGVKRQRLDIDAPKVKWHHRLHELGGEAIEELKRRKCSLHQENDQRFRV